MVAADQNLRNRPSIEVRGAGVMRLFEQSVAEALKAGRIGVTDGSRHQSRHTLNDRQRCNLAAGEYEIPQRDFFVDQMLGNPLVDALESPADEREMWD